MSKFPKLLVLVLLISSQLVSQNKESRWVVGVSVGMAKFATEDAEFIGDQFNFQIPRFNVSRYFYNGLSLDAGLSFNTIDEISGAYSNSVPYFSMDGNVRYDFGETDENLVPYIAFGGSLLKTTYKLTPTFNFGGGGTFWLNSRYGINTQLLYKYSPETFQSMRSHFYFSVGMVYSLKLRTLVRRLWQHNR